MNNWLLKLFKNRKGFDNYDHYFIEKQTNQGRRFVISDIHGCSKTFSALLNHLKITRKDHLFLLGDYIDRGPDSAKVLDTLIDMMDKGYNVFPIRGNHEQMLLDQIALENWPTLYQYLEQNNTTNLLDQNGKIKEKYVKFIQKTAYYFELDKYFLVHAGFNFNAKKPFLDFNAMLWTRDFEPDTKVLNGKKVVHGHTPISLSVIVEEIEIGYEAIPLDNGCVFYEEDRDFGNLLCLNLDTLELIIQKNLDLVEVDSVSTDKDKLKA